MSYFLLFAGYIHNKAKRPQNIANFADALRSSLVGKIVGKED